MVNLKADALNTKINIMDTIKKYGIKVISDMKDLKTENNICYFNFRCEKVNSVVQKKIAKPSKTITINNTEYYKGLELVCREHYKNKNVRLSK